MNAIKAFLFLIPTLFLFNACKKSTAIGNDSITNIPANVSSVTAIDIGQLMEKADFENVKKMEFFQDMLRDVQNQNPALAKVLENPASSGIDLTKNAYTFNDIDAKNLSKSFNGIIVSIANKADFESLLASANVDKINAKEGYQQAKQSRNSVVAWNDEIAVLGSNTIGNVDDFTDKIFKTTKENSIASNEDLKKCMANNHDVVSWLSSNAIAENPQAGMFLAFANIKVDALKDNFIHSYVDFNKGEVVSKADYFLQNDLKKDLDLFFKDEVKTDFKKYVPGDQLNFAMTTALDFNGINQVLTERPQAKSYVNFVLQEYGLSLDDISDAFNGDLLLSTYNNTDDNGTTGLFMTKIGKRDVFDKFISLAIEYELLTKTDDNTYSMNAGNMGRGMSSPFGTGSLNTQGKLVIHDDILFMSADEDLLNSIKAGTYKGSFISKDKYKMLSNNIFAAFADIEMLKNFSEELNSLDVKEVTTSSNRKNSVLNVEMNNKNVNSLKSIFEMVNKAYLQKQKDDAI